MTRELINQTMVAAELAKQSGFIHTYQALLEFLETAFLEELDLTPSCDDDVVR